jgi:hypothetical protein
MKNSNRWTFRIGLGCLALGALCILPLSAQDAPDGTDLSSNSLMLGFDFAF